MKTESASSRRLDILGNGDCLSHREMFAAIVKQWRRNLGYLSIFAAVPAILASHVEGAHSDDEKKPEAAVAGHGARLRQRLNVSGSNPALLKQQSAFRLPHQGGSFNMLATLSGKDDCPGQAIPGGNYTAAAPYVDSGDTTGANDTVSRAYYMNYIYYNWDAFGPDHIYSFTLTSLGANPRIEVSTTSGTYKPLIYVLHGGTGEGCQSGTGNHAHNELELSDSRWGASNTAFFDKNAINFLPLNVPLYLFVDSRFNDANGSGPYTLRMQDVTIAPATQCSNANPIDCTDFFVRQHYLDFLDREPDATGYAQWQNILNNCGISVSQPCDRIEVSSAFFRSPEFYDRGFFIYRFYAAVGKVPHYAEFTPDMKRVTGFLTQEQLEANKVTFVNDFMTRAAFVNKYGAIIDPSGYVAALEQTTGVTLSNRGALISGLQSGTETRATVLRKVAESPEVSAKFFNEAFVIMQYFGYLHRDADILYLQWIKTMNETGDYRTMINGFVNSAEYRQRFGPA